MESTNYYVPKEIVSNEFQDFSVESKLLFSVLLCYAKTASAVDETARLVERIGIREISKIKKQLADEINGTTERENDKYV